MSFQNPAALWSLLPLGGIVILLYLLKMRRRNVRVPATFLWPAKVEEVRANALFQKLKPSWLLFLQLLALTLVVFSIARPQTQQAGLTGEITVLVLDVSASMSATDVGTSRFSEAKRLAREAIASARPGDRVALIEAGPTPRVVFPLGNDPSRQLRELEAMTPTDAEVPVGDALRLAAALVGSVEGARIVLLSDGVFEPVKNFSRGKAALVYKSVGQLDDNLSISALGAAETDAGRQLYCGIKNHSSKPIDGTLTLYADGKPVDSLKMPAVAPGGNWGHTIGAPPGAKVFEARLEASDVLKSDNYAVSLSDPAASLRILLVSKGNPFLERALSLDPRVTLDRSVEVPTGELEGAGQGQYDVVIFDGIVEQAVKARGVLTFGSAGPSSSVTVQGTAKAPEFVSAEESPLLQNVDLRGVFIDAAEKVTAKARGEVLAATKVGPLVVASQAPGKRQVYVGFEPLESDFPLQISFPIFIANALDYLAGGSASDTIAVKAGQPFSVPGTADASLKTPAGTTLQVKAGAGNLVVREARQIGEYSLDLGSSKKRVFASLRSERESNITPVKTLPLGGGDVQATESPMRFADFWRPLALLALLVLAGEWWLFARRS